MANTANNQQTFWHLVFHCSERLYLSINWLILNLCQFPNSFCFMRIFWVKSLLDQIQSFCVSIPCFPLKSPYILMAPQQSATGPQISPANCCSSNAVHQSNHSAWKILAVKHTAYCIFPMVFQDFSIAIYRGLELRCRPAGRHGRHGAGGGLDGAADSAGLQSARRTKILPERIEPLLMVVNIVMNSGFMWF